MTQKNLAHIELATNRHANVSFNQFVVIVLGLGLVVLSLTALISFADRPAPDSVTSSIEVGPVFNAPVEEVASIAVVEPVNSSESPGQPATQSANTVAPVQRFDTYTDRYWQMAAEFERDQAASNTVAPVQRFDTYTDRYWQMANR